MSDEEIKQLLHRLAERIRCYQVEKFEPAEVILNVAAVVENMEPSTVR